jgi:hypothetical protein
MKILHDSDERAINFRVRVWQLKQKYRFLVQKIKWWAAKNISNSSIVNTVKRSTQRTHLKRMC